MTHTSAPTLVATQTPARRRPGKWRIANIIDGRALRVKLSTAALDNAGDLPAARKAALEHLHGALFRGRMIAQERLQQGADGLDTARLLSAVQDEVISALYDFTTTHIVRASNPTHAERLAVLATGGYGRGVMAPSSDTDLLFLRAYKESAHTESVIEYMLYALWDMGLKVGNAFRTAGECVRLAREDVTIKTSMLDARYLCGDKSLADDMMVQFTKECLTGTDAEFIADKLAERDARHTRQGDARYVVEPNIKEGKGGLRDLQTLFWITKHVHGGRSLEDVLTANIFTPEEYRLFQRAAKFLWTVRCHIHYVTGRPEERLSFDLQPEIAQRMGYRDRSGQLGVERFMKRYFLVAKDVGMLTRTLAAKLEAEQKKTPEGLMRFLPRRGPQAMKDDGFTVDAARISVTSEEVMTDDPVNMLRLFLIADREGRDIHPDAMMAVTRNLKAFPLALRQNGDVRRMMLAALLETDNPGLILRRMNEADLLGRIIPEFGGIVAQTQFNMYHHYTVDEHTIRAVEAISDMEHGRVDPVKPADKLFDLIDNRRALYLAMLLHDTGKGLGDQQIEGMKTATRACKRLGLPAAEVDLVAWLVGNHLEMSETAQKRDISDPRTVSKFAGLVGSLERLRLLYILTVADIKAVGPGVWNTWKGQLLADLYHNTAAALRGGRTDEAGIAAALDVRAERRRAELLDQIGPIPPLMLEMETAYWTGFDTETLIWQARCLGKANTATSYRLPETGGAMEVMVTGPDRPGLFADLAGALAQLGANIISAQVYTGPSGRVIDIFRLQDIRKQPFGEGDPSRMEKLEQALMSVFAGVPAEVMITARKGRREAAFMVQPSVQIRRNVSSDYLVIDIGGRDRPVLLYEVASALAGEGLSIHSAHVGNYGERVFDAFYVTCADGTKDLEMTTQTSLKARLLAILGSDEPDAPETPARKLKRSRAVDSF